MRISFIFSNHVNWTLNHITKEVRFLQEPDSDDVIKKFAAGYNVKFAMFSKINVNGSNALPLYKYLKSQLKGTLGRYLFICYLSIHGLFNLIHKDSCSLSSQQTMQSGYKHVCIHCYSVSLKSRSCFVIDEERSSLQ